MAKHWKFNLWRNALTNYLRVGLRMITGLVMFRLLFQHFTEEQFGYWSLLWSVFGVSVLLDFGMGSAAQRETAYCSARKDWQMLSRLMSTMVWTFALIGCLILVLCFLVQPYFLRTIHASPENLASFSRAYWIFFGSMAISFPLGLFPEMLAGSQRLDLVNWTMIGSYVINVALIYTGVVQGWSLEAFVLIGVVTSLGPNLVALFWVRRLIPELRLSPKLYQFESVKGVLSFSIVAYFITLTNIIITKTDQAVISVCLGVALVSVYQAGFKVADVYSVATQQMQKALSPTAAHLKAVGDHSALSELLIKTMRLTVLVAIPGYALGMAYLEPMVCLVTGLDAIGLTTYFVAHFLLLSTCSFLLTSSCSKQILVMSGWEKPLLRLSVTEALMNLGLSIVLALKFGVVGVAAGTLVPAVLIGWFGVLPLTLKFMQINFRKWFREVCIAVLRPIGVSFAMLAAVVWLWPLDKTASLISVAIRGAIVMAPIGLYAFKFRRGLF